MEDGDFRTDDTSLATFLSLEIDPTGYKWVDKACFWFFPNSDRLASLVRDFSGGDARVDPRKYSSAYSKRKKEMNQAMQDHRKKKRELKATRAESG